MVYCIRSVRIKSNEYNNFIYFILALNTFLLTVISVSAKKYIVKEIPKSTAPVNYFASQN